MQPAPNYKYRPSLIEENPALLLWLLVLGAYFGAVVIAKYAWFLHDHQIVELTLSDAQLSDLVATVPPESAPEPVRIGPPSSDRPHFQILDYVEARRRVGRNWVTQCPSCAAAGHDRSQDNLAISVEEPWKYLCWAGCTKEQIRAALGAPAPTAIPKAVSQ